MKPYILLSKNNKNEKEKYNKTKRGKLCECGC